MRRRRKEGKAKRKGGQKNRRTRGGTGGRVAFVVHSALAMCQDPCRAGVSKRRCQPFLQGCPWGVGRQTREAAEILG